MSSDAKKVDSKELFKEGNTVHIVHNGAVYTLRITKDNKLILTK